MPEPYLIPHEPGWCGGCLGRIWWRRRWAHKRCEEVLNRHRAPYVTSAAPHLVTMGYRTWAELRDTVKVVIESDSGIAEGQSRSGPPNSSGEGQ